MDGGVPPPLPAAAAVTFREGIDLVLSRWSALEIVVTNECGGRDSRRKATQLSEAIFSYFTSGKGPLYIDDLEDLLDQTMDSFFHTDVDDGSIEEVAEKLMIMHEECLGGNYQSVQRMREAPRAIAVPHVRQGDSDDDNNDSDSGDGGNMVIDQPGPRQPPVVPDADGWTTVPSRRNRGNRS